MRTITTAGQSKTGDFPGSNQTLSEHGASISCGVRISRIIRNSGGNDDRAASHGAHTEAQSGVRISGEHRGVRISGQHRGVRISATSTHQPCAA